MTLIHGLCLVLRRLVRSVGKSTGMLIEFFIFFLSFFPLFHPFLPPIQNATLHLSSIILPDGAQRVRTYEDQLQMRSFYAEGDLICAEVQSVHHDGTPLLHTRSFKYGKLENGLLVKVPPYLVPRQKQHFISLSCGVDMVLALNGYLWLSRSVPTEWQEEEDERVGVSGEEMMASLQRLKEKHRQTPTEREDRLTLIRVRNSILTLKLGEKQITPENIMRIVSASLAEEKEPKEMMYPEVMYTLLQHLDASHP